MRIAIQGCAHGELEKIYQQLNEREQRDQIKIDLLLCCGDFQSTRNKNDLKCMACPDKYKSMCSFYKYYSGEKVAPVLTIFIGGNHEASNYLQELPYGGWVAPNIFYLGYAGVVNVAGLRIAGISGIFKGHDYLRGRYEVSPYSENTKRSVYHTRNLDVFRLKQLSGKVDIFLSHDWPRNIWKHGDVERLLKQKRFFRDDINTGKLGSPSLEELLNHVKPVNWFSAHLHCKFEANVTHENGSTKFLALDKCLPNRRHLEVLDIEHTNEAIDISYDLQWLTILRSTNHLLNVTQTYHYMPSEGHSQQRCNFTPTPAEETETLTRLQNILYVPLNFTKTVAAYDPTNDRPLHQIPQPEHTFNPQTLTLCAQLQIDDPVAIILKEPPLKDPLFNSFNESRANVTYESFCQLGPSFTEMLRNSTPIKSDLTKMELPEPKFSGGGAVRYSPYAKPDRSPLDSSIGESVESSVTEFGGVSTIDGSSGVIDCSDDMFVIDTQPGISGEIMTVESPSAGKTTGKTFKRRNASLYTSDD